MGLLAALVSLTKDSFNRLANGFSEQPVTFLREVKPVLAEQV